MWEEIAEDQRQKSKIMGKQWQEVFSGGSEKTDTREAAGRAGREFGALPSSCSWSGEQRQPSGLDEGYAMGSSASSVALAETLWR